MTTTNLHLVTRAHFDLAPPHTIIRHPESGVGVKTEAGQWLQPGCADPADQGWYRSMAGALVITWGLIVDQSSPWFGVVTCPECGGSGWDNNQPCTRCGGGDTIRVGGRMPVYQPDDDDLTADELTERAAWDLEVERIADHFEDRIHGWAS